MLMPWQIGREIFMSLRENNKKKCRAKILKASRRLFKEKGYEGTTIDEIAKIAEISRGTFYNYFPDKESLLEGTAREEIENWQKYIEDGNCGNWEEAIQRALMFLILDTRPNIALSRKIISLAADPAEDLHPMEKELSDVLRNLLMQGAKEGAFRKDATIEGILGALIGLCYVGVFQWAEEEEKDVVKKVEESLDIIMRGVKNEK